MLLGQRKLSQVDLMTPKGILLHLKLEEVQLKEDCAQCAVRKDGGDDPDTTNGILVYAKVQKNLEGRFLLEGGAGVGRVTKPGLEQPVGSPAINKVPRAMIQRETEAACSEWDYEGGLTVTISVPQGKEIAKKTFNPRLGIEGGISILGTSGIVEPMSETALISSIQVEMKMKHQSGEEYLLVTPGNYGADYLRGHMDLPFEKNMKCSNYVGEAIDMAVSLGVKGILFVAHIGKFVKVAAGIMNTHSHSADGRMEVLAASAVRAGAGLELVREILECGTTDEALALLEQGGYLRQAMAVVLEKIQFYLDHRSYEQITLGAVIFSNVQGYLGQTRDAGYLIEKIRGTKGECCSQHQ
ncbi:putative cobalt-precorrin-6A synthase [deacetylating] [Blautia hydrogenotrophica CAG:147]|nr:cobalt-precorrin-5B (C(1))-methyltransferase CbiD [Blautia hydrogenotrophica]CCX60174.1 putative cobalt-precorrin-6A synthase [deacetylating] [Blautia hydrogenotrophica CAG:147]